MWGFPSSPGRASRRTSAIIPYPDGYAGPGGGVEFAEHVGNVVGDGVLGYSQLGGDLTVGQPAGYEESNLPLTACEHTVWLFGCRGVLRCRGCSWPGASSIRGGV